MTMDEALEFYGTKAEIARIAGVLPKAVSTWGDTIPRRRAYTLRKAMETYQGSFDEAEALEKVKANIEREHERKLKAINRMISSIRGEKEDD